MNIRKIIDYSEMYAELDKTMAADIPQMELYCEIGKAVCQRTEKGAAVAAAAYLSKQYPDVQGFSPRNLRRMRDFYRSYQDHPALLSLAMGLGWTQNVVILESGLSTELHDRVREERESLRQSLSEYVTRILREHFEGGKSIMTATKTLAFQIPEELDMRIKKYLASEKERTGKKVSQREFIVRLIEQALDAYEAADTPAE